LPGKRVLNLERQLAKTELSFGLGRDSVAQHKNLLVTKIELSGFKQFSLEEKSLVFETLMKCFPILSQDVDEKVTYL